MDDFEKLVKVVLLFVFCFLNAIDMVQTLAFLRMGIESNPFIVDDPLLWAILKTFFTFGFPPLLYLADIYLDSKNNDEEDRGFLPSLGRLIAIVYVIVFFADIFFLLIVSRNAATLGRLLP